MSCGRSRIVALAATLMMLTSCDDGGGSSSSSSSTPPPVNNTEPVSVNLGPANNDANVLFVSVTICVPGTSTCQTIPNIEIDTGSIGLRIFSSQVSLALPKVSDGSGNALGNCVMFADNSFLWGPVAMADVKIAGESGSSVPIQIVSDPTFPAVPNACSAGGMPLDTVASFGAAGSLGVGVFRQDCGPACAAAVSQVPSVYFSCPSSGCSLVSVPLLSQLQNPVWRFPQDNNGILISLPSVAASGAPTVSGSLIFGIGTQSDNSLGGAQTYTTDGNGNYSVIFNGNTYSSSFIDSGSNGIFFLNSTLSGIALCPDNQAPGFYCPPSPVNFSVIATGTNGASGQVAVSIANALTLLNSPNSAFINLGGPNPGSFDLGLPFFFGRQVFVGIEGQSTPGGVGPLWAY
jgi:hypothetical protein